jgi:LPS-assembly protein
MKNKLIYTFYFFFFFFNTIAMSNELEINSSKINYDDNSKIVILEENVSAFDSKNNRIFSEYAKYDKTQKLFQTSGDTKIVTSQNYEITGTDVFLDDKKKIIYSNNKTKVIDTDNNQIFLEMFNYSTENNILFSKGNIKIIDNKNNVYNFSEIYIDEKKMKMVGSEVKVKLNDNDLKVDEKNDPRFYSNTVSVSKDKSVFSKGVFTYCKIRENDKCPPWSLQSEKIEHRNSNKTIYYENAILKVYDFPIFYFPKFSHPDPSVKRKSGLLIPSFTNTSNLGSGFSIPYFWNIANDKDLTFTPKIYYEENPLFLAEYRQDFESSFLIIDGGYTEGYKKNTSKNSTGSRTHLFSQFNMNFVDEETKNSNLEINYQSVSNNTYFKIHDIDTSLIDTDFNILENTVDYTYENEDVFFGVNVSAFENTTIQNRKRYEYLLPYINFEKNLLVDDNFGVFDLSSKLRVKNYDVNKQTEILVNDFGWKSNKWISDFGIDSRFEGLLKAVNYNASKDVEYKTDENNSELSGVIGIMSKLGMYRKGSLNKTIYSLTPKTLLRYAPGHMRNIDDGRLTYSNLFDITKTNEIDVIEKGLSTSIGFDFKNNNLEKDGTLGRNNFSLSVGQVISEKENMDIPSSTSLDQRFSDVVGESVYNIANNLNINYNFSIDQSYKELNYSEIGLDFKNEKTNFNINYLEEKNHIGNQEYVKSDIELELGQSTALSFSTKRNLQTNSAEFYNLSYDYINDCLRAGIAYRREFYTDRDIEPNNSLMFTLTIVPFGKANSPAVNK